MQSSRVPIQAIVLISIIGLSAMVPSWPAETMMPQEGGVPRDCDHISASYQTTRIDAIIDYLSVLYSAEDRVFRGWLSATPFDPRIGLYPSIYEVYDPFRIVKQLGREHDFNWTDPIEFLRGLVNTDPASPYYGLVNRSIRYSPSVITLAVAAELFPQLGLEDWLYPQEIANYIAQAQTPQGGFRLHATDTEYIPDMIVTWSALEALHALDLLSEIDTVAALEWVMSCYQEDGGFSNWPEVEPLPDVVPLGLFSLEYLGRTDLIRVEDTTEYLLQYWDNSTGCARGGTIVNTERLVWSLLTLGTFDRIDETALLEWVLACQTSHNGAFLSHPAAESSNERMEWCRAAVHILYLCDRLDLLEEEITVQVAPEYTVDPWYIDYVNEHFGTTTTPGNWFYPVLPNIDLLGMLVTAMPYVVIGAIVASPGLYILWAREKKRAERRAMREKRKRGR